MKILTPTLVLTLAAGGGALAIAAAPLSFASAEPEGPPPAAADHGNWTLKEREDWLHNRLDKSKDDGSLSHAEYDRVRDQLHDIQKNEDQMRDHQHGQLTDNQTVELEARLDQVAHTIHWVHEDAFRAPW